MTKDESVDKLLWSIAFPGFGQFSNGKYIKGFLFTGLELLINVKSHLNKAILDSFQGNTSAAVQITDYQWLMFYPCIYLFAMWDAYKDAGGAKNRFSHLPFVCAAYLGTIGVAFSMSFSIMGVLLGPVWLPLLTLWLGVGIGWMVMKCCEGKWCG